jgi:hypothetical protein
MEEMRGATELPLNHQSITWRVPTKGTCYSQESKKGASNGTYRRKAGRDEIYGKWGRGPPL